MNSRSLLIRRAGKRITISCRCSSRSHFVSQVFPDAAPPELHQSAAGVLMWIRLKAAARDGDPWVDRNVLQSCKVDRIVIVHLLFLGI